MIPFSSDLIRFFRETFHTNYVQIVKYRAAEGVRQGPIDLKFLIG